MRTKILNFFRRFFLFYPLDAGIAFFTRRFECCSLFKKILPNNYQYKPGTWREVTRDGIRFRVDLNDYLDWKVYFSTWNMERKALFSLVREGDVVYDVGTHKGAVLLHLARRTGSSGRVYGFEAYPQTYEHCRHNLSRNPDLRHVQLYPVAVGDREGRSAMTKPAKTNSSGNRIAGPDDSSAESADLVCLDGFLDKHPEILPPRLVKIMTNGHELHGLRGARTTILRHKPILFLELGDGNLRDQGDSGEALIRFLEECCYDVRKVKTGETVTSRDDFSGQVFDVVALPTPAPNAVSPA